MFADVELIKVCLTGYHDTKLYEMSQRERIAAIKADKVGALALRSPVADNDRCYRLLWYDAGLLETSPLHCNRGASVL